MEEQISGIPVTLHLLDDSSYHPLSSTCVVVTPQFLAKTMQKPSRGFVESDEEIVFCFFLKNLLEWMGLVYLITTTIVIMIFSEIDLGTNKHTCTRAYLVSLNDQGIPPCTVETNFRISSVDLGTHRGFEVNSQVPN